MPMKNMHLCDWNKEKTNDDKDAKIFTDADARVLYLYGDINTENCASIAFKILEINVLDDEGEASIKNYKREPIKLYINSTGGNIYDMWQLVDAIMASRTPVHTYCNGYAMSAAFILFLAGQERYMSPHATLMYHQIYCWRDGKYQDLVEDREHTDYLNETIENFVVQRTKLTKDNMLNIRERKRDTYFTMTEAKKSGILSGIIGEDVYLG